MLHVALDQGGEAPRNSWTLKENFSRFSFLLDDYKKDGKKMVKEESKEEKMCAQCSKTIEGKFLLRALDKFWHEECLKCSYCNTQLADLSFKFYLREDLKLCKRDYIR